MSSLNSLTMTAFLVVTAMLSFAAGSADTCQNKYVLNFKPYSDPGTPSFITTSSTRVPVYPFVSLPPIILAFKLQTGAIDLTLDGTIVQAVASPLLRLGGDTVQLTQGLAIFRALQVQQFNTSATHVIQFSITVPYGFTTQTYTLTTPPLYFVASPSSLPVSLQFGNYGLLFRSQQMVEVPVNTVLESFSLRAVDLLGKPALASTTLLVSLRYGNGLLGVTVTPSVINMTGTVQVSNLQLLYSGSAVTIPPGPLVFTAEYGGQNLSLTTGNLTLVYPAAMASCNYISFDKSSSFFQANNIGNTAVLATRLPPVVIRCLNSALLVDNGATGTVITASVNGAQLIGNAALVLSGFATFADLQFVGFAPQSVVITFTATFASTSSSVMTIRQLVSGEVTVSNAPIKSRHLGFGSDSSIQGEQSGRMFVLKSATSTAVFNMLSVIVRDSAYAFDPTASGVALEVQVVYGGTGVGPTLLFPSTQGSLITTNGQAKIPDFALDVTAMAVGETCSLRLVDRSGIRASLTSGTIQLVQSASNSLVAALTTCMNASLTCELSLSFAPAPLSYLNAPDQVILATVGNPIPEIRVYLNDLAGPIDPINVFPTNVAQLYVYTGVNPASEQYLDKGSATSGAATSVLALQGVWMGSYFSFPCLQFSRTPSQLVRLQFGLFYNDRLTNELLPVAGMSSSTQTIRSGFLSLAPDTTGNFGLTFVSSSGSSYFSFAGQRGSGVIGVAFPRVQLQIVDSLGNLDSSGVGLTLTIATSSGSIATDEGVIAFVDGVATITTLRYLALVEEPFLTFTVTHSAQLYPVAGRSISTGPIRLSTFPIQAYRLGLVSVPLGSCPANTVCPSFEHQPLTFANTESVVITTTIRVLDSTDLPTTQNSSFITVAQSSNEIVLGSSSTTSVFRANIGSTMTFSTTIQSINTAFANLGTPIYLKFSVVDSQQFQGLLGSSVTVGPIVITSLVSASRLPSQCAGAASAPVVIVHLHSPYDPLTSSTVVVPNFLGQISYLMGVEMSRIQQTAPARAAAGVTSDTSRWDGTRISLRFTDPLPTSSNRDSAATLANSLVNLRPDCNAPSLGIVSIFYAAEENACILSDLNAAIAAAAQCSVAGFYTQCQCYQDLVITPMGVICSNDIVARSQFSSMCQILANCQQSVIIQSCSAYFAFTAGRYVWMFGAVFGGVGLLGVSYYGIRSVILRPAKVRLHKD